MDIGYVVEVFLILATLNLLLDFIVHHQAHLGQHFPGFLISAELVDEFVFVNDEQVSLSAETLNCGSMLPAVHHVFVAEDLASAVEGDLDAELGVRLVVRTEGLELVELKLLFGGPKHLLHLACIGINNPVPFHPRNFEFSVHDYVYVLRMLPLGEYVLVPKVLIKGETRNQALDLGQCPVPQERQTREEVYLLGDLSVVYLLEDLLILGLVDHGEDAVAGADDGGCAAVIIDERQLSESLPFSHCRHLNEPLHVLELLQLLDLLQLRFGKQVGVPNVPKMVDRIFINVHRRVAFPLGLFLVFSD